MLLHGLAARSVLLEPVAVAVRGEELRARGHRARRDEAEQRHAERHGAQVAPGRALLVVVEDLRVRGAARRKHGAVVDLQGEEGV